MGHAIQLKHKHGNPATKGRKHCVHNQKHTGVSGHNHHVNIGQREPSRPITEPPVPDGDQTIVYEVYERKINTIYPVSNVNVELSTALHPVNDAESGAANHKTKRLGQYNKHIEGQHKSLQNINFTKPNIININPNCTHSKFDGSEQNYQQKIPFKESQEIDFFTPIKVGNR